jgi:hydrogenase maturation factor HypF (carbamoyltransferase family)
MINFLYNNRTTIVGMIGATITIISKYLEELGIVAQIVAGIGGIAIVCVSLSIKIVELLTKWKEYKHGKS